MDILDTILAELPDDVDMLSTFAKVAEEMRGDNGEDIKVDDVINSPKIAQICLDKLSALASSAFGIDTDEFVNAQVDAITNIGLLQRELTRRREQHLQSEDALYHYNITCQNM